MVFFIHDFKRIPKSPDVSKGPLSGPSSPERFIVFPVLAFCHITPVTARFAFSFLFKVAAIIMPPVTALVIGPTA